MSISSPTSSEPITASWKISRVLQSYPELLDVLIDSAPAFERLRNPLVRRVQSRLVTVEQAAGIAGLDASLLVARLNEAAGLQSIEVVPAQQTKSAPAQEIPDWVRSARIAQEIDVRPYQKRGEEPFSAIMEAARQVPVGEMLALHNTFAPTPLYQVMSQRGFDHWARQLAEDDWEIFFYHTGSERELLPPIEQPKPDPGSTQWSSPTATITIDVSELVPPEPMIRILSELEALPAGSSLLVHHVRRPMHLYPRLDELGFRHETRDLGPGKVELLIEKPANSDGAAG
ncbi:MAG: DUF2249 domain-containing protein [Thermomicrobiales bacterium]|nr:MAG: DUF2249 domain-containing protein [Thermomicrobiales bacterium]